AIPYHTGYYYPIRERGRDLVAALLTPNPDELRAFIQKYQVDLMIVSREPATLENIKTRRWFGEIIDANELEQRFGVQPPAVAALVDRCKVWEGAEDVILDARAIVAAPPP